MIDIGKYKVEEVTKPQVFDPPKEMLVWSYREGRPDNVEVAEVLAIISKLKRHANVIYKLKDDENKCFWACCCGLIKSEVVKHRYATNLEFSRWLSQGNGQVRTDTDCGNIDTAIFYDDKCDDTPVRDGLMARKWGDKEWHEPTIDYLGIKED